MRLLEAIIQANHRAVEGDHQAGIRPGDYSDELPVVALTCIDPRLNPLMPEVLGIPEDQFVWLRNAGNIITGPLSSTMRSLALACAIKGGKEIAIIGHTDCQVGKTTALSVIDRLHALGIERSMLPDNIGEFFGMFASERQNIIKGVEIVRRSPLIGPRVAVHGLLVDIRTGKLEWIVNGYDGLEAIGDNWKEMVHPMPSSTEAPKALTDFKIGEGSMPSDVKIGEAIPKAGEYSESPRPAETRPEAPPQPKPATPPKIPVPPPFKQPTRFGRGGKWEAR